jgi:NAD-dependent dihydropyrimidine dehydrogenase PreA subunit
MENDEVEVRYPGECWHCGACRQDCPTGAVSIQFPLIMLAV